MDDIMWWFRLTCYLVGLAFSFMLAGRMWAAGSRLGRIFGVVMGGWALHICSLLALLIHNELVGERALWTNGLLTINALVLCLPVVLYVYLTKNGE